MWLIEGLMKRLGLIWIECSFFPPVGGGSSVAYEVKNSLRFRSVNSAYLSFTPSAAGDRKKLCRRFRIKRGATGSVQVIHSAGTSSIDRFYFDSSDRLCLDVLGTTRLVTTPIFRDPAALEIEVGFELDVANATASSRAKIIYDGAEVSAYSTDTRSSITNADTNWNNTVVQYIGRDNAGNYFDGLIAEPLGASGTTTVTSYSQVDPSNSKRRLPRKPSATYGTGGWFLDFTDGTNLTTLCADKSGNGNNWSASGISLTSGVTYDLFSEGSAGYCVLNPLDKSPTVMALSNGNLRAYSSQSTYQAGVRGTVGVSQGIWCWEITATVAATFIAGITKNTYRFEDAMDAFVSSVIQTGTYGYRTDSATKYVNGAQSSYGVILGNGDVMGFRLDLTAGTLTGYRNGVSQGVIASGLSGTFFPLLGVWNGGTADANFGQQPMAYSYGSDAKPINTANLTDTTVITSGSFTGTGNAYGPSVFLNGWPTSLTINGNAVTWGVHAIRWAGGFKVISSSSSYNSSGSNSFVATFDSPYSNQAFKFANAQAN